LFVEEATWARSALERLPLPPGAAVVEIGSSTEHYRTVEQPHIESEVLAPLRARGAEIFHVDAKEDAGVDLAVDLATPGLDLVELLGRRFDLVLATSLVKYFPPPPEEICALLRSCVDSRGWLLATTSESYRQTPDPIDYGYRPSPDRFAADLVGGDREFSVVEATSVRIDDPRYYQGLASRKSVVRVRGHWLPLPGVSEQLRYRVRSWRWRASCVVLRRGTVAEAGGNR
jgi:hypothetical protein